VSELGNENTPRKGRVYLDNCGIPLAAVYKLLIRYSGVMVYVHAREDLDYSLNSQSPPKSLLSARISVLETDLVRSDLFGSVLILCMLNHRTDHLVDRPDNLEHLDVGDCPVLVHIVQIKDP